MTRAREETDGEPQRPDEDPLGSDSDWRSDAFWLTDLPSQPREVGGLPVTLTAPRLADRGQSPSEQEPGTVLEEIKSLIPDMVRAIDAAAHAGLAAEPSKQLAMAFFLRNATIERRRASIQQEKFQVRAGLLLLCATIAAAAAAAYGLLAGRWPVPVWATALSAAGGLVATWCVVYVVSVSVGVHSNRPGAWGVPIRGYLAILSLLAFGLASATVTLSVSYPGTLAAAALAIPALALAGVATAMIVNATLRFSVRIRLGTDPYIVMALRLTQALGFLRDARSQLASSSCGERIPLPLQLRREIADKFDSAARAVGMFGTFRAKSAGGTPEVQSTLIARRAKVLGWLYDMETRILWPAPQAAAEVDERLVSAITSICFGDWSVVDCELPVVPRRDVLRRVLPRLALTAVVLGLAWGLPAILGTALSDSAVATLRLSLTITAVTALITPATALRDAAQTVGSFGSAK